MEKKPILHFEITSREIPQHNSQVERKIATIYGKVTAALNAGGFDATMRKQLWEGAVQYVTTTENLVVRGSQIESSYKQFFREESTLVAYLRILERS